MLVARSRPPDRRGDALRRARLAGRVGRDGPPRRRAVWVFETRAIHGGTGPDPSTGAVNTPVYLSSTFRQEAVGVHRGFEYARSGNPTRASLEANLAVLEGAAVGFAFASGLAAEDAVMRLLGPGDHLLLPNDTYGGTFRLATKVHAPAGLAVDAVDLTDLDALRAAWQPQTRMVWIETPTNPLLRTIDIAAVASIAHDRDALVVVDNTFATPWLQQPLALGADVVVHSTTKYLSGHSDVVGGFAATSRRRVVRPDSAFSRTRPAPCRGRWTVISCSAA